MDDDYLPFHSAPKVPDFKVPEGAVDAHCHVFGPGDVFPWHPARKYTPCDASKEQLFALRDHLGLTRNVIVQATCHGPDNAALVDALEASDGRARGVAVVSHDITDEELRALHDAGVRGVRFNFVRRLVDATPREVFARTAERVAALGWHIVVYFEAPDLPDLEEFLAQMPTIVVVDHMGRPDVSEGVESADFQRFLRLMAENEHIWVKTSCPERLTIAGPPYDDVVPFARTLVERFPDRVLWGTDWPHPNMKSHMPDDGQLVDTIPRIAVSETAQRALLIDNPMRLYWRSEAGDVINAPQLWADRTVATLATIMVVACFAWNVEAPTRMGVAILTEQYMALQLGLALTICYLRFGWRGPPKARVGIIDGAIATVCFCVLMYAAWDFVWLLREQSYRPWQITLVGAVVTLAVMEGIRRRAGLTLFTIVALFMVYALFADRVPGDLIGVALTPERLVGYVGFDPSAVFSTPLRVGTIIVLLFVFFGQLLFSAGGGAFFTDLAMAATGRSRGGSAKISVVGSALFGSISGSAVSNVVTTGVITIPLMQRGGYSKRDSGAIEAVASTGGQLTPPIMGAAAFLMAEFLEISYMTVAAAALLPAALYYISIFMQVDLMAGRDKIKAPDEELLTVREVMAAGWHFILPFAVLLGALFYWRMDPEDSALLASVAIVCVSFARSYRGTRLTLRRLGQVFVDTGTSMVDLILVVAAAGFVIGILNITGLGFALTLVLVEAIGSNLILLLMISAVICILLGMGMPTSGVYVLLATLVAPSLVRAGVEPVAAHLFILYFGMMSMITPPVALAAIAAASITKTNAIATGFAAMRIGWAAYIIPFLFVATPALLMDGTWIAIASAGALSVIGIGAVCVGMVGFLGAPLGLLPRGLFAMGGLAALPLGQYPDTMPHLGWIAAAGLAVLVAGLRHTRRETPI